MRHLQRIGKAGNTIVCVLPGIRLDLRSQDVKLKLGSEGTRRLAPVAFTYLVMSIFGLSLMAQGQNLIVNGSFESPALPSGYELATGVPEVNSPTSSSMPATNSDSTGPRRCMSSAAQYTRASLSFPFISS